MRWLITGAAGMLGRELTTALAAAGETDVTAATHAMVDICDPASVAAAVLGHDLVINVAAWTDVDAAEADEAGATRLNGAAVGLLARACAQTGARLVQISTDYVFSGESPEPYPEDAPTAPINAYGRSKEAGERAVLSLLPDHGYVVRTAWLYATHSRNFVNTMLRLATERDTVEVVDDQFGQPTWAGALAEHLVTLGRAAVAGQAPAGIYHGTSRGRASWFDLARAVFAETGLDPARVRPTTSEKYVRAARRPTNSVLGHAAWERALIPPLPHWRGMLVEALSPLTGSTATPAVPPGASVP